MPGSVRDKQCWPLTLNDRVKPRFIGYVVSAITLLRLYPPNRDQKRSQRRSDDEGIVITVTLRPHCLCYSQVFQLVQFRGNSLVLIGSSEALAYSSSSSETRMARNSGRQLRWCSCSVQRTLRINLMFTRKQPGWAWTIAKAASTIGAESHQHHTVQIETHGCRGR